MHIRFGLASLLVTLSVLGCADVSTNDPISNGMRQIQNTMGISELGSFYVYLALGPCGNPCIPEENYGGEVEWYTSAAEAVRGGTHALVQINAHCASACVLFADKARPNVCIGPHAEFYLHMAKVTKEVKGEVVSSYYEEPPQSQDILDWVRQHGGFPQADDSKKMLRMGYEEAEKFWPTCKPPPL